MADLNAATLDDVKTWFKSWYGPNNAVLVLAGDIDAKTAKEKTLRYFGDIPASATLKDLPTNIPKRTQDTREVIPDRVPQVRIYRAWPVAEYGSRDGNLLPCSARCSAAARPRVWTRAWCTATSSPTTSARSSGPARSAATSSSPPTSRRTSIRPRSRAILDEELQRLLREGPTAAELEQAKTAIRADFVRGIERIGGFGGKSDVLAECAVYAGKPDCYRDDLDVLLKATPAEVQAAGRKWLGKGSHTVTVQPSETPASALAGKPPAPRRRPRRRRSPRPIRSSRRSRATSTAARACRRPAPSPT